MSTNKVTSLHLHEVMFYNMTNQKYNFTNSPIGVLITQLYDSSGCSGDDEENDQISDSSSYTSDVDLYTEHYQTQGDIVDYDTDLDITEGTDND